ncbi:hypothetical protein C8J56DRAFT_921315, partial [Mycena floridula]
QCNQWTALLLTNLILLTLFTGQNFSSHIDGVFGASSSCLINDFHDPGARYERHQLWAVFQLPSSITYSHNGPVRVPLKGPGWRGILVLFRFANLTISMSGYDSRNRGVYAGLRPDCELVQYGDFCFPAKHVHHD